MTTTWEIVYVPEADAAEVRALVAERQASRNEPASPSVGELDEKRARIAALERRRLDQQPAWPATAFAGLAEDKRETATRWAQVLDLAAATPGRFISTEEVAAETDLSVSDWRSACRTLRRILPSYEGVPTWADGGYAGELAWPLADLAGRTLGVRDQLYVGMTAEQASVWLSVR